mmetsp:Transcript_5639/g.14289  ORF Transcript_5639/g.14289 Transcript_5639/m.14289 type:complete len:219 (-) Transcript_5639:988-1644(-)
MSSSNLRASVGTTPLAHQPCGSRAASYEKAQATCLKPASRAFVKSIVKHRRISCISSAGRCASRWRFARAKEQSIAASVMEALSKRLRARSKVDTSKSRRSKPAASEAVEGAQPKKRRALFDREEGTNPGNKARAPASCSDRRNASWEAPPRSCTSFNRSKAESIKAECLSRNSSETSWVARRCAPNRRAILAAKVANNHFQCRLLVSANLLTSYSSM